MALHPLTGAEPAGRDMLQLLRELQGLTFSVVNGAAADTNIAVTGLGADDTICAVVRVNVEPDTGTDATGNKVTGISAVTAEAAITSAGNIQLADTDTTGDQLLVVWFNKNPL